MPSGENMADVAWSLWPPNICTHWPVSVCHTRIVPFGELVLENGNAYETMRLPSGEKLADKPGPGKSFRTRTHCPVSVRHTKRVECAVEARSVSSGEKAKVVVLRTGPSRVHVCMHAYRPVPTLHSRTVLSREIEAKSVSSCEKVT